ncbi:3-oxoadipyl-CoA thiolase [Herbaspirillum sp. alder98]|uniref:3-oxoadipyl-CoA thiolase n=1 Tax=Herbaspirillum sp. alder98 TaxID=2913096 RepID=UPI001CD851A7|nr:3-oxoadipyl-CoA thiolase [Herbaspirillum sp. alder98]MCA1325083.1 3-oxoadipyl-CoA thiolase [Herbaspirillum sp. alder98]
MSIEAFICDAVRTPIGRYGGSLSGVRADDLAAAPIKALMQRNPGLAWDTLDDVILGCANQAGEDNRNVARMAALLAGMPIEVGGSTVNRLCGSGMDAVGTAVRAIRAGDGEFYLAGGVESMSRAPFVVAKAEKAFSREALMADTTIGWRMINARMTELYGTESLGDTAENVAADHGISRADQDAFALRSQEKAAKAQAAGRFAQEIVGVQVRRGRETVLFDADEHPRAGTTLEQLASLKPAFRSGGSVTAGNSSGVNDGAAALLVASEAAAARHGLVPRARVLGVASAGVAPRVMGMGPVPATQKLLARHKLSIGDIDLIELNEAFASQGIAVLRQLGLPDDAEHVNPNGGAIALGHPLGMSGARLVMSAVRELELRQARYALCTMCIGVGQGISLLLERV